MRFSLPAVNARYEDITRCIPIPLFKYAGKAGEKPHLRIRDIVFGKFKEMEEHLYLDETDFDRSLDLFFGASVNTSLPPYGHAMLMVTFADLLRHHADSKLSDYFY